MLALRLLILILSHARSEHKPGAGPCDTAATNAAHTLHLDQAERAICGDLARVPDAHLPDFDFHRLALLCGAAACNSAHEAAWVTPALLRRLS